MKPHPSVFHEALSALGGVDPARAVFVGDRPYDDIHGARAVGMRTVLRHSDLVPPYDVEPDATISSLSELVGLCGEWQAEH